MFRRLFFLTVLGASVAFGATGDQWFTVNGTYTSFNSDFAFKNKWGYGLAYGVWMTDNLGLELSANRTKLEDDSPFFSRSANQTQAFGSFLIGVNMGAERFFPYLALGVGGTRTPKEFSDNGDNTTRINYHAGVGAHIRFAERYVVTLDSKYVRNKGTRDRNDWVSSVGIGMVWGPSVH